MLKDILRANDGNNVSVHFLDGITTIGKLMVEDYDHQEDGVDQFCAVIVGEQGARNPLFFGNTFCNLVREVRFEAQYEGVADTMISITYGKKGYRRQRFAVVNVVVPITVDGVS